MGRSHITPTLKMDERQVKDMSKSKNKDKDRLVKNEIARLKEDGVRTTKVIDSNRRLTAKGLIEEAAYMKITLQELTVGIKFAPFLYSYKF